MEPSEEIRRVIDRWMVANSVGETDAVIGRLSDHPGALARVASQALGGEVLVSNLVRELVAGAGPGIEFLESRDVELKGLEGSHRIYAVDLAPTHA